MLVVGSHCAAPSSEWIAAEQVPRQAHELSLGLHAVRPAQGELAEPERGIAECNDCFRGPSWSWWAWDAPGLSVFTASPMGCIKTPYRNSQPQSEVPPLPPRLKGPMHRGRLADVGRTPDVRRLRVTRQSRFEPFYERNEFGT
jgi:hypothetical protein